MILTSTFFIQNKSAVLVNQTSLFIMFGLDKDANPTNDLLILDVRNSNNISFANHFPFDIDAASTSSNVSSNSSNSTSSASGSGSTGGLSTGAIAGIAVGGVVAVSIIFLFLFYHNYI